VFLSLSVVRVYHLELDWIIRDFDDLTLIDRQQRFVNLYLSYKRCQSAFTALKSAR